MQLDFRASALDAMRDYGIQPKEVIYAVEHPVVTRPNKSGRLVIYEGYPEGRLIVVKVDARDPRWVVYVQDYH